MKKTLLVAICIILLTGCKSVKLDNGENAIVTFKEGGISAQELYDELKDAYGATKVVDLIDNFLLKDKYKSTSEEKDYVNQSVKSAQEAAEKYGVDLETYVSYYYGVSTEKAFRNLIALNYKRSEWTKDYSKELVSDKQINDYYETETVGDMTLSHILISIDAKDSDTDEQKKEAETKAYNEAKDIIAKLKEGKDFSTLAKEFSDDEDTKKNGGALGKVNVSDYSDEVIESAKDLKVGSYSETPVKSTYGYHIIYKTAQDEKPELNDELKDEIRGIVGAELAEESGFQAKALTALREKNEMKFVDTDLEKAFNKTN